MILATMHFLAEDYNYCVSCRSLLKTITKTHNKTHVKSTEMKNYLEYLPSRLPSWLSSFPSCIYETWNMKCQRDQNFQSKWHTCHNKRKDTFHTKVNDVVYVPACTALNDVLCKKDRVDLDYVIIHERVPVAFVTKINKSNFYTL